MNFIVFTIIIFMSGTSSLRLLSYQIPSTVDIVNEAVLSCEFDAERETIDTYTWSVNGTVFYTHSPLGKFVNHVTGVNVRLEKSGQDRVVLGPLELASSGVYRCQAATKSATPNSLAIQKSLNVVAYPRSGPTIDGIQGTHTWGQTVELNCTSAPSYPPAHIVWTVKNVPVKDAFLVPYPDESTSDIRSTKTGVRLNTEDLPFGQNGKVTVTCTAMVPGIYRSLVTLTLEKAQVVKPSRTN